MQLSSGGKIPQPGLIGESIKFLDNVYSTYQHRLLFQTHHEYLWNNEININYINLSYATKLYL